MSQSQRMHLTQRMYLTQNVVNFFIECGIDQSAKVITRLPQHQVGQNEDVANSHGHENIVANAVKIKNKQLSNVDVYIHHGRVADNDVKNKKLKYILY